MPRHEKGRGCPRKEDVSRQDLLPDDRLEAVHLWEKKKKRVGFWEKGNQEEFNWGVYHSSNLRGSRVGKTGRRGCHLVSGGTIGRPGNGKTKTKRRSSWGCWCGNGRKQTF